MNEETFPRKRNKMRDTWEGGHVNNISEKKVISQIKIQNQINNNRECNLLSREKLYLLLCIWKVGHTSH